MTRHDAEALVGPRSRCFRSFGICVFSGAEELPFPRTWGLSTWRSFDLHTTKLPHQNKRDELKKPNMSPFTFERPEEEQENTAKLNGCCNRTVRSFTWVLLGVILNTDGEQLDGHSDHQPYTTVTKSVWYFTLIMSITTRPEFHGACTHLTTNV